MHPLEPATFGYQMRMGHIPCSRTGGAGHFNGKQTEDWFPAQRDGTPINPKHAAQADHLRRIVAAGITESKAMTLHLTEETAAGLTALAGAHGLSVEDYVKQLVERELPVEVSAAPREGSGMVWENGLFVYRTGNPLPGRIVDNAIRRSRDERAQHVLGSS